MKDPKKFMESLNTYKDQIDNDRVPGNNFKAIRDTLALETFTPENIATKSSAAAGVCDWIRNITSYYDVFVSVEPKKAAVAEAKATLAAANEKKGQVDALVADLNAKLQILLDQFNIVMKEKNDAMAAAEKCERKMNLAQRLVGALGSELDRWQ
jgi:dynein heavy chain